jgi:hypothetical protein
MLKVGRGAWSAVMALVALGILALASWMYARSGFGALAGIASGSMVVHMDFDVFWHSARALWEGRNLYYDTGGPDSSTNPPFWTLLISPLGLLKPLTAYRSFVLITVLASVVSLACMATELRLRAAWAAVGVGLLIISSPMLGTLALGQMYPLLSLGLVAAWVADRRGEVDGLRDFSRSDRGRQAPARPRASVAARKAAVARVRGGARLWGDGDACRNGRGWSGGVARVVGIRG